ncbi:Major facilitator superfamily domain general substrate transporter [Penicillium cf. griseofulvum]|uniref:Major facilitator superfamily domain general substrate transporter n=1 Tax=Penicillium cf. griseofulvum TaxID=2972120 RepID=A0A9W9IZT1_9EURO|nr:Major facilitator superfamily domain general substrate transporter [Penicillium cf. griseofulvum]KAJ5423030.1 Major facilitator superfamily domain general substrate transporter [Penicillium cf. griseofulvum]KAJ5433752.1 Major facilitator superfamily domain general substrate transporter [Penicillium cf. griseofulvum]
MSDHVAAEENVRKVMSATESHHSHDSEDRDSEVDHEPIQERYGNPSSSRFRRVASKTIVSFGPNDPANPVNWRTRRKFLVLASGVMQVMNSTIGSSICSNAIPQIAEEFDITNETALVLPISIFLIGYILGPLLWGPSSEYFGRKPPLLIAYVLFMIFTLACAVADSYESLLVFRLFNGMVASAPIATVGGLFADVHDDPTLRGRLMAYFMACTTFGPIIGPWLSGFVAVVSWRWCFWIGLILSGASLPLVIFMPETYAPVILKRRAHKLRKDTGNSSIVSPLDVQSRNVREMMIITISRPFRMIIHEYIVSLTSLYLALAYAIFYLYFEAYPIIFQGVYKMSPGVSGLMFLPIGIGAILACGIFIWYDGYLARAKARNASWAFIEEYRRLPLACIGGPLYVISLFWVGWTASPNIHWVVPFLSGIPFGMGYLLIFMAMLNYLTDAYETLSASAQSAASCTRSILGAVLPLAAKPMFNRLGVPWACSLIAFLSLGVSVIPFAFIRYGDRIRANSKFCQELKRAKEAEKLELEREERLANGDDTLAPIPSRNTGISMTRIDTARTDRASIIC